MSIEDYKQPTWDDLLWLEAQINGWTIPCSPWWARLPIIRHLRAMAYGRRILAEGEAYDRFPTGHQIWMNNVIWRGLQG